MTARYTMLRGGLLLLGVLAFAGCPRPRETPPVQRGDNLPLPEGLPPFPEPERLPLDDLGTSPEASMAMVRYLDELCGMMRKERVPVAEMVRHLGRKIGYTGSNMAVQVKPYNPAFRHGQVVDEWLGTERYHDVFYVELEVADPNTLTLAALRRVFGPAAWSLYGVHGGADEFVFHDEQRQQGMRYRCKMRALMDLDPRLVREAEEPVTAEYGTPAEPKKPPLTPRQWNELVGERINARVPVLHLFREGMSEEPRPAKR